MNFGGMARTAILIAKTGRADPIGRSRCAAWMQHRSIARGITALDVEQDQRHDDAAVGQRLDLGVELGDSIAVEREGPAAVHELHRVRCAIRRKQANEIDVDRRMRDAERDRVIHHLDLQPLLGSRLRIGNAPRRGRMPQACRGQHDAEEHGCETSLGTHARCSLLAKRALRAIVQRCNAAISPAR